MRILIFLLFFLFFVRSQFIPSDDPCQTLRSRSGTINVTDSMRTVSCWRIVPDVGLAKRSSELRLNFLDFNVPAGRLRVYDSQFPASMRDRGAFSGDLGSSTDSPPAQLTTSQPAFLLVGIDQPISQLFPKNFDGKWISVNFAVTWETSGDSVANPDVNGFIGLIFMFGFVAICVAPIKLPIFKHPKRRERLKCLLVVISSIAGGFFMLLFLFAFELS